MALQGIKVIEFAGLAPAPFCGMVLADFGALITKIDKVGANTNLDVLSNGKKSISIDLKHEIGRKIIRDLCSNSDVLIEPFRRGVMEKLGLGPDLLMKENPKLIYARLTGFGQNGYYADRAGHDINYLSISGILSLFSRTGQKPTPPVNLGADFGGGGLLCALGIVSALFEREKSGLGQIIDSNMVEGSAYLGSWLYRSQKLPIWGRPAGCNILDSGAHFYETYKTKDGKYMALGALEPQFYDKLLEGLGVNISDCPQFENFEKGKEIFTKIFLTKTQEDWCKIFDTIDACVTPVLSLQDAPEHKHNLANCSFKKDSCSSSKYPIPAPRFSRTPGISTLQKKPPECGEHTVEILKSLNYSNDDIQNLRDENVIYIHENNAKL